METSGQIQEGKTKDMVINWIWEVKEKGGNNDSRLPANITQYMVVPFTKM